MKVKAYNLVNSVEQEELDAGLLAESFSVEAKQGKAITCLLYTSTLPTTSAV